MKTFTNQDVIHYYDQTEVHYRRFWKLEQSMGLHYGVWDTDTQNVRDAVLNTNRQVLELGRVSAPDQVLDAGCGVGGSAIYLARNLGCTVTGITLSAKQVATATAFAQRAGVAAQTRFLERDYTATGFAAASFDVVWAIESMQTAPDKALFFREAARLLKPGGRLLIADIFKPFPYAIAQKKSMQWMLHGWAMSDILQLTELQELAEKEGLHLRTDRDVTREIEKSVTAIYYASLLGMVGTALYNLFRKASFFSRIHYKTGIGQHQAYRKKLWEYHLLVLVKS